MNVPLQATAEVRRAAITEVHPHHTEGLQAIAAAVEEDTAEAVQAAQAEAAEEDNLTQ